MIDFIWPESKYYIALDRSDIGEIHVKGTNELICTFTFDYRGLIYQHIYKNHEQDFIDLGVQYNKKRVCVKSRYK